MKNFYKLPFCILDVNVIGALDDFEKVQVSAKQHTISESDEAKSTVINTSHETKQSRSDPSTVTEPNDKPLPSTDPNQDLEQIFAESFAEAAGDLEKAMKAMLGEGDQDFMRHIQNQFSQSAAAQMSSQGK